MNPEIQIRSDKSTRKCKFCDSLTTNKVFCSQSCAGKGAGYSSLPKWRSDNPLLAKKLDEQHGRNLSDVIKGNKRTEPESHPCKQCDSETTNRVFCSQSCSAKYNNTHGLKKFREEHPEQPLENLRKFRELNPTYWSENGKIQGKKYGLINGPKIIRKYNETHKKELSERGKKHSIINFPKWRKENPEDFIDHQKKAGKKGGIISGPINGRRNVENGTMLKARMISMKNKQIPHLDHIHVSKHEHIQCMKHYSFFPKYWVHPLVSIGSREIDWVISSPKKFNEKYPSTWLFVIEYHPPIRYGKKHESFEEYKSNRISVLRYLGVQCPILVYFTKDQWTEIVSTYHLNTLDEVKIVGSS